MNVFFGKKRIDIDVRKVVGISKVRGLMFKSSKTDCLLFEFSKGMGIHSYFVFFRFLAVWLNKENAVVGFDIVRPFEAYVGSKKNSTKLIEIPFNDKNSDAIRLFLDGERFK